MFGRGRHLLSFQGSKIAQRAGTGRPKYAHIIQNHTNTSVPGIQWYQRPLVQPPSA